MGEEDDGTIDAEVIRDHHMLSGLTRRVTAGPPALDASPAGCTLDRGQTARASDRSSGTALRRTEGDMQCGLCGSTDGVATYGVYPPMNIDTTWQGSRISSERWEWNISPAGFKTRDYCDECIKTSKRRSVRHAASVFFLPTVGMMRLWKFATCSKEEMGDLMAASEFAQSRDPRLKHIIWPYGSSATPEVPTMEYHLTREAAAKRLAKKAARQ
jgi:hypothetical protein